jgi:type I restriction enzyme S subunit
VRRAPVPIAPLPEQRRIVAEIDRHFTRLDAAVASLKRAQANLKRYRATVLQAACEGRLVPTESELARAEGREYEPAERLLGRILDERRAAWEVDQLCKLQASGKFTHKTDWTTRYVEPVSPATGDLPMLPDGWMWVSVDLVISDIQAGKSFKCQERPPSPEEFGVAKVSAVTWGEFNDDESKPVWIPRASSQRFSFSPATFCSAELIPSSLSAPA